MITLTRLSGSVFVLNSDLIERIDATPDTVITLVDGKKYVVSESLEQVIDEVRRYRGDIIAMSAHLADDPGHPVEPPPPPRPNPEATGPADSKLASVARLHPKER